MAAVAVTAENREELFGEGTGILYFTAVWCGPCQQFGPVFAEVSEEFPGLVFGKVDVDAEPELAASYGIRSIPTLIVHRNGDPIFRSVGAKSAPELRSLVKELL